MKRATILTTNENSEKRGQIQNISQQKINTKTPKNAYNLNVGKIVGLNVGKRKLQKAPTNTDYRITKKQYQNSENAMFSKHSKEHGKRKLPKTPCFKEKFYLPKFLIKYRIPERRR
ncbi:hypothetical protein [Alistipes shahii]|jgi:hypothetical protein|uniref:hypothetical protein n=1 Tax=Alistipes shahii TaxID=328814 RepID=UPI0034A2A546